MRSRRFLFQYVGPNGGLKNVNRRWLKAVIIIVHRLRVVARAADSARIGVAAVLANDRIDRLLAIVFIVF